MMKIVRSTGIMCFIAFIVLFPISIMTAVELKSEVGAGFYGEYLHEIGPDEENNEVPNGEQPIESFPVQKLPQTGEKHYGNIKILGFILLLAVFLIVQQNKNIEVSNEKE